MNQRRVTNAQRFMDAIDMLSLISTRANEFFAEMPGIREGRADSVHDARVACRRLRELLPLIAEDGRAGGALEVLTEAGRHLGRVRDLDVMMAVLAEKESVVPAAALAAASARRALAARIRDERSALIKALERLDLSRVAVFCDLPRPTGRFRRLQLLASEPSWGPMLRDRVGLRSHRLRIAVEHAAGIYFPKRLHAARIAVKKLRYTVEVAAGLHMWEPPHLLDDLKKVQGVLGTLHDAQVISDRLAELVDTVVPGRETAALASAFESDIARLHTTYLGRRARLGAIARACDRFASGSREHRLTIAGRRVVAASTVSAVAIPATLALLHRRADRIPHASARERRALPTVKTTEPI